MSFCTESDISDLEVQYTLQRAPLQTYTQNNPLLMYSELFRKTEMRLHLPIFLITHNSLVIQKSLLTK